jgi:hypothetical protein
MGMKGSAAAPGQALVELAVVAPALIVLTFGVLQLGLLGYAGIVARFAAFAGVRGAAIAASPDRAAAARAAAATVVAHAPGIRLLVLTVTRVPLPLRGANASLERMVCRLFVSAPHLFPFPWFRQVAGAAAIPMEPSR